MLAEEEPLVPIMVRGKALQFLAQQSLLEQLFLEPDRQRHAERGKAARREGEIGFEQPLECEEWFVVEDDVVDSGRADLGFVETILDGVAGKPGIVLLAGEAFLLRGSDDPTVGYQGCRAVMVE